MRGMTQNMSGLANLAKVAVTVLALGFSGVVMADGSDMTREQCLDKWRELHQKWVDSGQSVAKAGIVGDVAKYNEECLPKTGGTIFVDPPAKEDGKDENALSYSVGPNGRITNLTVGGKTPEQIAAEAKRDAEIAAQRAQLAQLNKLGSGQR